MRRESTLARTAWLVLLVCLGAYLTADLVRSPLLDNTGAAAVEPARLTLWVPGPEAGGEGMLVAHEAAAGLELAGHTTSVKRLPAGSAEGVTSLLAGDFPTERGALLVLTSSTLADIAHARADSLVPGASQGALVARELLLRSAALGLLATDPLLLGVPGRSPLANAGELMEALLRRPDRGLVAIGPDSFSQVVLAAALGSAGVVGQVRFELRDSGQAAVQAAREGSAAAVLAPRGAVLDQLRAGQLRPLPWPAPEPLRSWVVLVAPPSLGEPEVRRLRSWVRALTESHGWRGAQRRRGRRVPGTGMVRLRRLLRDGVERAERLERQSALAERR